jgi:hypothetical protein
MASNAPGRYPALRIKPMTAHTSATHIAVMYE